MRILIADDDEFSRVLLTQTLVRLGHEVTATVDGRAAWEAARDDFFPVLITDWLMPHLNGLELCSAIRRTPRDLYTYIILLTALGGKENYLEGMRAGADDFITKPFDMEQLSARLHVAERILGLRRHVQHLEGLLPICASCKKIRDDKGSWNQLEVYISNHADVSFTHGLCPECAKNWLAEAPS